MSEVIGDLIHQRKLKLRVFQSFSVEILLLGQILTSSYPSSSNLPSSNFPSFSYIDIEGILTGPAKYLS